MFYKPLFVSLFCWPVHCVSFDMGRLIILLVSENFYGQKMCLLPRRVSTDRNVYMEKACVYRKDMYLRTRHLEYFDQCCCIEVMIRMMYMVCLYLHNSKTSALQQKCIHTSGFINGVCLRTRHFFFGIVYNYRYDKIRDSIHEKSSAY